MHPRLIVMSQSTAESYEPTGTEICISITNPNAPLAQLSPRFAACLRLCFSDARPDDQALFGVVFDAAHAIAIRDFVAQWPLAERIVVHCKAGNGRSPGVALGLCDLHGWPTEQLESAYPWSNKWVRKLLAAARTNRQAPDP
jgi:predicted protein tyrosine phosphatase